MPCESAMLMTDTRSFVQTRMMPRMIWTSLHCFPYRRQGPILATQLGCVPALVTLYKLHNCCGQESAAVNVIVKRL